jgi:hypothetical protein
MEPIRKMAEKYGIKTKENNIDVETGRPFEEDLEPKIRVLLEKIKDGLIEAGINEKYIFDKDNKDDGARRISVQVLVKQKDGSIKYEVLKTNIHPIKEEDDLDEAEDGFIKQKEEQNEDF